MKVNIINNKTFIGDKYTWFSPTTLYLSCIKEFGLVPKNVSSVDVLFHGKIYHVDTSRGFVSYEKYIILIHKESEDEHDMYFLRLSKEKDGKKVDITNNYDYKSPTLGNKHTTYTNNTIFDELNLKPKYRLCLKYDDLVLCRVTEQLTNTIEYYLFDRHYYDEWMANDEVFIEPEKPIRLDRSFIDGTSTYESNLDNVNLSTNNVLFSHYLQEIRVVNGIRKHMVFIIYKRDDKLYHTVYLTKNRYNSLNLSVIEEIDNEESISHSYVIPIPKYDFVHKRILRDKSLKIDKAKVVKKNKQSEIDILFRCDNIAIVRKYNKIFYIFDNSNESFEHEYDAKFNEIINMNLIYSNI